MKARDSHRKPLLTMSISHRNCEHEDTKVARAACRRKKVREEMSKSPLTPEERTERAKKAAAARWADSTPEKTRESNIKRIRTEAAKLGFDLVPINPATR